MDADSFEIGIICALPLEADAVIALLDRKFRRDEWPQPAGGDNNSYTFGTMDRFNVVIAHLGDMGPISSSQAAGDMRRSFSSIRQCLVIGICGAIPFLGAKRDDEMNEILLGDVIISQQVVQYDFGRQYETGLVPKGSVSDTLGRPHQAIRNYLAKLKTAHSKNELSVETKQYLAKVVDHRSLDARYHWPGYWIDHLYPSDYSHKHRNQREPCKKCEDDLFCEKASNTPCENLGCSRNALVPRKRVERLRKKFASISSRPDNKNSDSAFEQLTGPGIHIGRMASGSAVIKASHWRDKIAARDSVIAFEMEGAGVWDVFPTVVIKSVCDYADSHKNKRWQNYAAATAAACAKAFLVLSGMPGKSTANHGQSYGLQESRTLPSERNSIPDYAPSDTLSRYDPVRYGRSRDSQIAPLAALPLRNEPPRHIPSQRGSREGESGVKPPRGDGTDVVTSRTSVSSRHQPTEDDVGAGTSRHGLYRKQSSRGPIPETPNSRNSPEEARTSTAQHLATSPQTVTTSTQSQPWHERLSSNNSGQYLPQHSQNNSWESSLRAYPRTEPQQSLTAYTSTVGIKGTRTEQIPAKEVESRSRRDLSSREPGPSEENPETRHARASTSELRASGVQPFQGLQPRLPKLGNEVAQGFFARPY